MATRKYPNEIIRDEHDEDLFAKKTSLVSASTVYAVVNTAAGGQSSIVLDDSVNSIGFATVHQGDDPWNVAVNGNVTLSDSKEYIGLVSVSGFDSPLPVDATGQGDVPVTLDNEAVVLGAGVAGVGFATVHQGDDPWNTTVKGNVTLSDSKTYIGLATVTLGVGNQAIGKLAANDGVDIGDVDVASNTAWTDPNTFIGLATVTGSDLDVRSLNSTTTLFAVVNTAAAGQSSVVLDNSVSGIGFATVHQGDDPWDVAVKGNVTLSDPKGFIGLATVTGADIDVRSLNSTTTLFAVVNTAAAGQSSVVLDNSISSIGFATVHQGDDPWDVVVKGNVTLSDSKTYIGLVTATLGAGSEAIGKLAANDGVDIGDVDVTSNTAWSDPNTFIGLVTVTGDALDVRSLNSTTTLFAVVNTAAAGQSSVVLDNSVNSIGFATVHQGDDPWDVAVKGNVTLSDPKTYVGLVTATLGVGNQAIGKLAANDGVDIGDVDVASNTAWSDPNTFIGLATVTGDELDIRSLNSSTTIFAVVNTAAAGQSSVVLDNSVSGIGFATVHQGDDPWSVSAVGNVTLSDSKEFIGLVSVSGFANPLPVDATGQGDVPVTLGGEAVVLGAGVAGVGFATVHQGDDPWNTSVIGNITVERLNSSVTVGNLVSSATLFAVVNTSAAGQSSVVLDDSISSIGFATVHQGDDPWNTAVVGNVTLSDARTYIGLVTARPVGLTTVVHTGNITITNLVSSATLFAVVNTAAAGQSSVVLDDSISGIGFATVHQGDDPWNTAVIGNMTLSDAKTYVGLVTATLGAGSETIGKLAANTGVDIGDVDVTSNTAWSDPNTYIGLVTVGGLKGNVTLSDAKTYIGLVTATPVGLVTTIQAGNATVINTLVSPPTTVQIIISATGQTAISTAVASNYFYVKDLIVGSLGNAEVRFEEGSTVMIPYISLATKSGYVANFGDSGMRAGTVNTAFNARLNGAATVSIMANIYWNTA
jgi:hypothetical protein